MLLGLQINPGEESDHSLNTGRLGGTFLLDLIVDLFQHSWDQDHAFRFVFRHVALEILNVGVNERAATSQSNQLGGSFRDMPNGKQTEHGIPG